MFEWVSELVRWLHDFISEVPIYVAGPAMIAHRRARLVAAEPARDQRLPRRRALLQRPEVGLLLPALRRRRLRLGCMLLYTIMRRGGQAVMRRRFSAENIERVERAYARFGFLALAVPALLPPPMPFKIFVATAGALEYPRWRFMLTIMIARSVRYIVEGTLAVFYGERVHRLHEGERALHPSGVGALRRRRHRWLRARQAHPHAAQEHGRSGREGRGRRSRARRNWKGRWPTKS